MKAFDEYSAYMRQQARSPAQAVPLRRRDRRRASASLTVQYTVRKVPAHVDGALRRKARDEGKSLNQVLRDALIKEAEGPELSGRAYTDLDTLAGAWVDVPGFDDAIQAQDRVDEGLWR